jgi:hypothetical protein
MEVTKCVAMIFPSLLHSRSLHVLAVPVRETERSLKSHPTHKRAICAVTKSEPNERVKAKRIVDRSSVAMSMDVILLPPHQKQYSMSPTAATRTKTLSLYRKLLR